MNIHERIEERLPNTKPIPRDELLRSLDGKEFDVIIKPQIYKHSVEFDYLVKYYIAFGHSEEDAKALAIQAAEDNIPWPRRKLSRIFPKISPELSYDSLCRKGKTIHMKISTNFKDILRCSETKHFSSCFRPHGQYRHVPVEYLTNPGVAIAYRRDKHGMFSSRVFLYLLKDNSILIGRPYGEINHREKEIYLGLSKICRASLLVEQSSRQEHTRRLAFKYAPNFSYSDIPISVIPRVLVFQGAVENLEFVHPYSW